MPYTTEAKSDTSWCLQSQHTHNITWKLCNSNHLLHMCWWSGMCHLAKCDNTLSTMGQGCQGGDVSMLSWPHQRWMLDCRLQPQLSLQCYATPKVDAGPRPTTVLPMPCLTKGGCCTTAYNHNCPCNAMPHQRWMRDRHLQLSLQCYATPKVDAGLQPTTVLTMLCHTKGGCWTAAYSCPYNAMPHQKWMLDRHLQPQLYQVCLSLQGYVIPTYTACLLSLFYTSVFSGMLSPTCPLQLLLELKQLAVLYKPVICISSSWISISIFLHQLENTQLQTWYQVLL